MGNDEDTHSVADLVSTGGRWLDSFVEQARAPVSVEACRDLVALLDRRLKAATAHCPGAARGPILSGILDIVCGNWRDSVGEVLERITDDVAVLKNAFRISGDLEGYEGGISEVHGGGRSVGILTFSDGQHVVHKPKDVGIAAWYMELVRWLNDRGLDPPLHVRTIVPLVGYGWEEFVPPTPCNNTADADQFYCRLGMLLRLFQILDGRDFHRENIVAHGRHPVPIDLETLFHPTLSGTRDPAQAHGLRTGILPVPAAESPGEREIELTVVGHASGLTARAPDPPRDVRAAPCVPVLDGWVVDPLPFSDRFVDGFLRMDRILRSEAGALLDDGLIDRAADHPVRVVIRDTLTYAKVLTQSLQPDALADQAIREKRLHVLWRSGRRRGRLPETVFESEADALRGLDIPRFETLPGSRSIFDQTAAGDPPGDTPLERVKHRLAGLPDVAPDREIAVIRSAFAMLEDTRS